jgi:hypothetical protein
MKATSALLSDLLAIVYESRPYARSLSSGMLGVYKSVRV